MPDITIKENRTRVEELLARYRAVIGSDYDGYRNHVYRAITYAMHFLNNAPEHEQLIDATQGWVRKGMSRSAIARVESTFPNCGFHKALLHLAKEYGGSTIIGGFKVVRGIVKL